MQIDKITELDYLLVLDFEATCIQDSKLEPCSQIIQFPIMVIDCKSCKIIDKFHHYVKPHFNPQLTKFCTQLTGIEQQKVDPAFQIQKVLNLLEEWMKNLEYLKEGNYCFVTCGDWDLNICLRKQAKVKKISINPYLSRYINIKKYFSEIFQKKSFGMMHMIQELKLKHEGRHHSGIDDVLNLCNICVEMIINHKAKFEKKHIKTVKF